MVFTPVDIGATCDASAVENVSRLGLLDIGNDGLTVLQTRACNFKAGPLHLRLADWVEAKPARSETGTKSNLLQLRQMAAKRCSAGL